MEPSEKQGGLPLSMADTAGGESSDASPGATLGAAQPVTVLREEAAFAQAAANLFAAPTVYPLPIAPSTLLLTNTPANAIPDFIFDGPTRQPSLAGPIAAVAPPAFTAADAAAGRPPSMSMCFVGDPVPLLLQDAPPLASPIAVSAIAGHPPALRLHGAQDSGPALPPVATDTPRAAIPAAHAAHPLARTSSDGPPLLSLSHMRTESTETLVRVVREGAAALLLARPSGPSIAEMQRSLLLARSDSGSAGTVPYATHSDGTGDAGPGLPATCATAPPESLPPESSVHATAQLWASVELGHRGTGRPGNDEALKLGAVQALSALARDSSAMGDGRAPAERRLWSDVHFAACVAVVRLLQVGGCLARARAVVVSCL